MVDCWHVEAYWDEGEPPSEPLKIAPSKLSRICAAFYSINPDSNFVLIEGRDEWMVVSPHLINVSTTPAFGSFRMNAGIRVSDSYQFEQRMHAYQRT